MGEFSVIGKPVHNVDAMKKAWGLATYTADLKLPGMLYGKILRSIYPHAKIMNIDTSRAMRLPGVKAVVTGRDAGSYLFGTVIQDKPAFAVDKVRFVGDEVAGIVAVDRETAEEAAELIRVDYQELPAVFDPVEAMQQGAPLIHEGLQHYDHVPIVKVVPDSNVCGLFTLRRGDVEQGFDQADYVFEDEFEVQPVQHSYMETPACIASVDTNGSVTVWSATQSAYVIRDTLATGLGIPANKVRVILPYIGGGFGGKYFLKSEAACVLMSQAVHKPVKVVFSREETFISATVRQPLKCKIKTGVNKDGTLVARKMTMIWNCGAYADIGPNIARNVGIAGGGPYNIPNVWVDGYTVYTNNPVSGAFRGLGIPQATWAIESHTDIIAEKLGIDPMKIRLKNVLEEGSLMATGQVSHAVGLKQCLGSLQQEVKKHKQVGKTKYRGVGIACMHKATATPSSSSAFLKMNHDGSAEVLVSCPDLGQGSNTLFCQIISEELGIPVEKITVAMPDTAVTPFDQATISSRTTFHVGNAVKIAAQDVKNQLIALAAPLLGADVAELELKSGKVNVKGQLERSLKLEELPTGGRYVTGVGHPVLGKGYFSTAGDGAVVDLETGQGSKSSAFWMYGAQLAEVEVDVETGKVKVNKVIAAHNVGQVMNPLLLEAQYQGSLVMGIGGTLYEELKWDKGRTLNPSFADYKLPTFTETPEEIESVFVEVPHREGPYGAMGIGEPLTAAIPAALGNAVYDAIGVRIKELPITPEKILKALREKSGEKVE